MLSLGILVKAATGEAWSGTHLELESKLVLSGLGISLLMCPDPRCLDVGLVFRCQAVEKGGPLGRWPWLSSLQKWREGSPSW